ncbi:MAG: hypothetical protein PHO27_12910 [Sulfuricurvum sp.]|jgi:hypothetical protein|nr:hypothetical protein [Sulfuricurvum sp.]
MDAMVITAIGEMAKVGLIAYIQYMKQAGLTDEQIDVIYQEAKAGMLARDPANIPDYKEA